MRDYLLSPEYRPDVRAWVNEESGFGPFAFETLCAALSLDAAAMRYGMHRWMTKVDSGETAVRINGGGGIRFKPLSGMGRRPKIRGAYGPRRPARNSSMEAA